MRAAIVGILVAGLAFAILGSGFHHHSVSAQQATIPSAMVQEKEGLMALNLEGTPSHALVALVDTRQRVMSVYQIDRTSGEISLKSVRKVHWDLQLDEFNGTTPTPREIQSLLQRR